MSFRRTVLSSLVLAVVFVSGLVVGKSRDVLGGDDLVAQEPMGAVEIPAAPVAPAQARSSAAALAGLPDLTAIAQRAVQASVNISSTQNIPVDPWFQLFYGADAVVPQSTLGSGVLVSADGYVLTNSHVVGDANADIRVTTADNRELDAKVVGIDPPTDLAVIKVAARGASPLPWGDSSKLKLAEWVLAIGNPFQFNQTVTLGIVSALNRHELATYNDFIQTDAAINPGNSGGALVNAAGELVGINTMIVSQSGGYQGLGFAIPSNLARSIMESLVKSGRVVRGSIGNLMLRTITADQARNAGLGTQGGAYVDNMYRSDPAYRAGVLPRDIIVRFNDTTITETAQLQRLVAEARIGSTVRVEVLRRGERRTFQVPVVEMAPPRRRF